MGSSALLVRAWRAVEQACASTLSGSPAPSRPVASQALVREAPLPELSAVVCQVRLSWFRVWASSFLPVAIGFLTAELLRAAPSLEVLVTVAAVGVIAAIITAVRPARTIVITADALLVPRRWSGSDTLRLSDIDREATIHPSRWHVLTGTRAVYARDGSHITLNVLEVGRSNVERIVKIVAA
jgi:hypothetical protein